MVTSLRVREVQLLLLTFLVGAVISLLSPNFLTDSNLKSVAKGIGQGSRGTVQEEDVGVHALLGDGRQSARAQIWIADPEFVLLCNRNVVELRGIRQDQDLLVVLALGDEGEESPEMSVSEEESAV